MNNNTAAIHREEEKVPEDEISSHRLQTLSKDRQRSSDGVRKGAWRTLQVFSAQDVVEDQTLLRTEDKEVIVDSGARLSNACPPLWEAVRSDLIRSTPPHIVWVPSDATPRGGKNAGEREALEEHQIRVHLKRVRWAAEDIFSNLEDVASKIDHVQWTLWNALHGESTSSFRLSPAEVTRTALHYFLLPYYATDEPMNRRSSWDGESDEGTESRCTVRFYGLSGRQHQWLQLPCRCSLETLLKVYIRRRMEAAHGTHSSMLMSLLPHLAISILTALEALHSRCGVAHGDVSSQNILLQHLEADCASLHFLLGDLESLEYLPTGAKRLEGDGGDRCPEPVFRGTLFYAPLERILTRSFLAGEEGRHSPSADSSDVWALGVVLLHIIQINGFLEERAARFEAVVSDLPSLLHWHPFSDVWRQRCIASVDRVDRFFDISDGQTHSETGRNVGGFNMNNDDNNLNDVFHLVSYLNDFSNRVDQSALTFQNSMSFGHSDDIVAEGTPLAHRDAELTAVSSELSLLLPLPLNSMEENESHLLEFLARCLHPNPKRRASASELLQSRWILHHCH